MLQDPLTKKSLSRMKMIFVGDSGVGKSSLINRLCHDVFNENTMPTIGVNFESMITHMENDEEVKVTFWDLGGQDVYKDYIKTFAKDYNIAAFTFDLTSRDSFEHVKEWMRLLKDHNKEQPKYLIGTKLDLNPDREEEQEISVEEIVDLKNEFEFDGYILTSAKLGMNVREPINALVKNAIRKRIKNGN